jgi:large subunit ribosomal protein L4
MQTDVVNIQMKKVGSVELNESVFASKAKPELWHEVVKWQLARKRSGTAATKERSEIKGSTRKIYRQKGTGNARHGSRKAPIFRSGGIVFGPHPRSYDYTLPRQVKRGALCSALTHKLNGGQFKVVDEINLEEIKTKKALAILKGFEFKSSLVIDLENGFLARSVRNLDKYKFLKPEGVNVYDLLKFDGVIISKGALEALQERLN